MKQKIIHILTVIVFLCIFAVFFGEEYQDFHSEKQDILSSQQEIGGFLEEFTQSDVHALQGETELYYTPYRDLLDQMVAEIDAATKRVLLEVYIFTERDIRDALVRARERGVEVKVLLENNPYKAPYLNDNHYNFLRESGVDVRWSDPLTYSLNHSKLLIIDDTAYISTGNFSYSLFQYNRDFLVKLSDSEVLDTLSDIFSADFEHRGAVPYHENLIVSPEYSRGKMERLITESSETIDFYFPYMQDESFQEVLFSAANRGVRIRGIVAEDFYEENTDIIEAFGSAGIELRPLLSEDLHAKAFLVDSEVLYVGSVNFSRYSFDENREIGILISDLGIMKKFKEIYEKDFSK